MKNGGQSMVVQERKRAEVSHLSDLLLLSASHIRFALIHMDALSCRNTHTKNTDAIELETQLTGNLDHAGLQQCPGKRRFWLWLWLWLADAVVLKHEHPELDCHGAKQSECLLVHAAGHA